MSCVPDDKEVNNNNDGGYFASGRKDADTKWNQKKLMETAKKAVEKDDVKVDVKFSDGT